MERLEGWGRGDVVLEVSSPGRLEEEVEQAGGRVVGLRARSLRGEGGAELTPREWADWLIDEVPRVLPELEAWSIVGMTAKKSELERLARSGIFEGARAIELEQTRLTAASFGAVAQIMEAATRLEVLSLASTSLGKAQFEALLDTGVVERLRVFELGGNASLGAASAKLLAGRAAGCGRLERVGLYRCGIAGAGAKALAQADWAGPVSRINMAFNPMRTAGLVAFEKQGRLGWLLQRDDEGVALSLHEAGVDARGLIALLESEAAAELEVIDFGWMPDAFDARVVRALLGWGRLGEVALPGLRCRIEGDAALHAEVVASGALAPSYDSEGEPPDGGHWIEWAGEGEYDDGHDDYSRWVRA